MKNEFEILEIINKYIDLETFVAPPLANLSNSSNQRQNWFDKHDLINKELKEKKLIGEYQNIYFIFNSDGTIENIHLQLETRNLPDKIPEERIEIEGVENVIIKRRSLEDIEASERVEKESRFDFSIEEWKNYKRTKIIDSMLKNNEKIYE